MDRRSARRCGTPPTPGRLRHAARPRPFRGAGSAESSLCASVPASPCRFAAGPVVSSQPGPSRDPNQVFSTRENHCRRFERPRGACWPPRRDAGTPGKCSWNRRATNASYSWRRPPNSRRSTLTGSRSCRTAPPRSQRKPPQGKFHSVSFPPQHVAPGLRSRSGPLPFRSGRQPVRGICRPAQPRHVRLRVVPDHARDRLTIRLRKARVPPRPIATGCHTPAARATAGR